MGWRMGLFVMGQCSECSWLEQLNLQYRRIKQLDWNWTTYLWKSDYKYESMNDGMPGRRARRLITFQLPCGACRSEPLCWDSQGIYRGAGDVMHTGGWSDWLKAGSDGTCILDLWIYVQFWAWIVDRGTLLMESLHQHLNAANIMFDGSRCRTDCAHSNYLLDWEVAAFSAIRLQGPILNTASTWTRVLEMSSPIHDIFRYRSDYGDVITNYL